MSTYNDAVEKAVKQVITQYFENHPVLSDTSVAENLAGLLNSDNEKIRLGAIKMWSILRAMKPRDEEQDAPSMEEILRAESQQKASEKEHEDAIYVDVNTTPQDQVWMKNTLGSLPPHGGRHGAH